MASPYISIAGPVGAGKSTLAQALAQELGYQVFLESDGQGNHFLKRFYDEPRRWALASQLHFALEALEQQKAIGHCHGGAIQDRSVDETVSVFARPLAEKGLFAADELELIERVARLASSLKKPDLLISLEATPELLCQRIQGRGRSYESGWTIPVLEDHCQCCQAFAQQWSYSPLLALDSASFNPTSPSDLQAIIAKIDQALTA